MNALFKTLSLIGLILGCMELFLIACFGFQGYNITLTFMVISALGLLVMVIELKALLEQ